MQTAGNNLRQSLLSTCTPLSPKDVLDQANNLAGKIILVTGAGSGIGAAFSLLAASLGAKVVLADRSPDGLARTKKEIIASGISHSDAVILAPLTDVTVWKQQQDMFDFTIKTLGCIDIVVCSAGISEHQPGFLLDKYDTNGALLPPDIATLSVNLHGSIFTTKLADHYFRQADRPGSIILLGSLASMFGVPMGPMYTPILPLPTKLILAGLPKNEMSDVVRAIIYAASRPKQAAGAVLAVDPKGILLVPHDTSQFGQGGFNETFAMRAMGAISAINTAKEIVSILSNAIAGSSLLIGLGGFGAAWAAYKYLLSA
ncbi:hypothetical protein EMMF5_001359 [Cystobasidiomycetes sp. EMM_F5]